MEVTSHKEPGMPLPALAIKILRAADQASIGDVDTRRGRFTRSSLLSDVPSGIKPSAVTRKPSEVG
jgi:hypothetical protein